MRFLRLAGAVCLVVVSAGLAQAKNPLDEYQQFSASASGGPLKWKGMKIYRSGSQIRAEYTYENEIRIANEKSHNGWVIRPLNWVGKPKECERMTLMDIASYPFFAYTIDKFDVERTETPESTETFEGHSCKVEEYTVKSKEGGPTIMMKLWRADDLKGFPVKIDLKPSMRPEFNITYSDISLDPPNPKLFQLPPLCRASKRAPGKTPAAAPKAPSSKPDAKQ